MIKDLSTTRDIVFINLVISSIGTIVKESKLLIDMLEKLGLNDNEISATIRKLINITTVRLTLFFVNGTLSGRIQIYSLFKYVILALVN